MSATTSIIKNVLRGIGTTLIEVSELTERIKRAVEYHSEEVSVDVSIDESVFLLESNPKNIQDMYRTVAIHKLVDNIISRGMYEITETKKEHYIVSKYKLTLFKDRGF